MQRVNNYGSFWQAYCLKQIIENDLESFHSNTVEFIDIIPGKEDTRTKFKPSFSLEKLKKIPYYIHQKKKKKYLQIRREKFWDVVIKLIIKRTTMLLLLVAMKCLILFKNLLGDSVLSYTGT